METRETEIIREVMLSDAVTPIDEAELGKFVVMVHEVLDAWWEHANAIDQQIVDLHYRRRMRFAEIAAAVGITENSARSRWFRLLARVADLLQERVRSDEELVSFASLLVENHDALQLAVPTFLSGQKLGPETTSTEVNILRRAVQTFGNHADAVHWLLDDCPALHGRPIDLLIDPGGVKDVENVLGCIDHGLIF